MPIGMKLARYAFLPLLALAANEPRLAPDERQWRREVRSTWLRFVVLLILVATLTLAKRHDDLLVHANLFAGYGCAAVASGITVTRQLGSLAPVNRSGQLSNE